MQQIYRRTSMPKCDFNKDAKQLKRLVTILFNHLHLFQHTWNTFFNIYSIKFGVPQGSLIQFYSSYLLLICNYSFINTCGNLKYATILFIIFSKFYVLEMVWFVKSKQVPHDLKSGLNNLGIHLTKKF